MSIRSSFSSQIISILPFESVNYFSDVYLTCLQSLQITLVDVTMKIDIQCKPIVLHWITYRFFILKCIYVCACVCMCVLCVHRRVVEIPKV